VLTDPLLRNGLHNTVVLLLRACMLRALPTNGRCLQSHLLATGVFVTIYSGLLAASLNKLQIKYIWGGWVYDSLVQKPEFSNLGSCSSAFKSCSQFWVRFYNCGELVQKFEVINVMIYSILCRIVEPFYRAFLEFWIANLTQWCIRKNRNAWMVWHGVPGWNKLSEIMIWGRSCRLLNNRFAFFLQNRAIKNSQKYVTYLIYRLTFRPHWEIEN
jgi:hypothetical protein